MEEIRQRARYILRKTLSHNDFMMKYDKNSPYIMEDKYIHHFDGLDFKAALSYSIYVGPEKEWITEEFAN